MQSLSQEIGGGGHMVCSQLGKGWQAAVALIMGSTAARTFACLPAHPFFSRPSQQRVGPVAADGESHRHDRSKCDGRSTGSVYRRSHPDRLRPTDGWGDDGDRL